MITTIICSACSKYKNLLDVNRAAALTLGLLILSVASTAHSIEATGLIGTGVEYTDNVRNASTNPDNDVIQRFYGELGVEEVRKRFRADANLRLEHEHYYEDSYSDETSLTSGFGLFTIDMVEEFLEWQATFSRTDVVSDTTEDENPDTREFRNIFRSGPSIDYNISRTTNFNFSALYVRVDNSDDAADSNERVEGVARLTHQLSRLTSFNVSARHSEILESDAEEEIDSSTLSAGFTRAYVDGELIASYGVQEIESNLPGAQTEKGAFVDVSATREAILGHALLLSYNQSISDTSIGFEGDEAGNRLDIDPTQATSTTDIETRDRLSFEVSRDVSRYAYDVAFIYEESDFQLQDYTDRYRALIVGYQPMIFSRLIPRFEYEYSRESYGETPTRISGEDKTHLYTLSTDYRYTESLVFDGFVRYEDRRNDTVAAREFDEFSIGMGIRWEFL